MAHLPGTYFCGPGTDLSYYNAPASALDAACQDHDLSYTSNTDYLVYGPSDETLYNKAAQQPGLNARIVQAAFGAKYYLTLGHHLMDIDSHTRQTKRTYRDQKLINIWRHKKHRDQLPSNAPNPDYSQNNIDELGNIVLDSGSRVGYSKSLNSYRVKRSRTLSSYRKKYRKKTFRKWYTNGRGTRARSRFAKRRRRYGARSRK